TGRYPRWSASPAPHPTGTAALAHGRSGLSNDTVTRCLNRTDARRVPEIRDVSSHANRNRANPVITEREDSDHGTPADHCVPRFLLPALHIMRYLDAGTGKPISKIGLGTHQFGSPDWAYGEQYAGHEARAIVRRAIELGVTLFDTAEIYGF